MSYRSDAMSWSNHLDRSFPLATWAAVLLAAVLVLLGCQPAVEPVALKQRGAAASTLSAPSTVPNERWIDDAALRERIDAVLLHTLHERELRLDKHAAWQIIHGVVAFGPNFPVSNGDERVAALDWAFAGKPMQGWTLRPGPDGVESVLEPGTKTGQGHPDQWLGYMALWGVPSSTPLTVAGREFQVKDLVTQAMRDVREGREGSWTLMALSTYLHPTQAWQARDGSEWTLERLVAVEAGADLPAEAAQDQINVAACGGSHRLIALAYALGQRKKQLPEEPLSGGWAAADERIRWAVSRAQTYQLPSGGFSVHYFARPSGSPDLAEHLGATGHTLELLALSLDDEELAAAWVARAANFLCEIFETTESLDLECGALYHAARGLVLYRTRRFGPKDYFDASAEAVAGDPAQTADAR
jgi:hypothetical protein